MVLANASLSAVRPSSRTRVPKKRSWKPLTKLREELPTSHAVSQFRHRLSFLVTFASCHLATGPETSYVSSSAVTLASNNFIMTHPLCQPSVGRRGASECLLLHEQRPVEHFVSYSLVLQIFGTIVTYTVIILKSA